MLDYLEQKYQILSLKLRKDYNFFHQCELNATHSVLQFYRNVLNKLYFIKIVFKSIQETVLPSTKHYNEVQWFKAQYAKQLADATSNANKPSLAVVSTPDAPKDVAINETKP